MALSDLLNDTEGILDGFKIRKVKSYDCSKNRIIVAGLTLDGVVGADVSEESLTEALIGVDPQYYTYFDTFKGQTLNLKILPTAECLKLLKKLHEKSKSTRAWFTIDIVDNGILADSYKAHIISFSGIQQTKEPEDKVIVFGLSSKNKITKENTYI